MLKVSVHKRRADFTLEVDFQAPTPGIVALFGRSGCGKTTIVNIIAGLLRPDRARIELDGTVLEDTGAQVHMLPERRRIGYVFQDGRLFPHMSVRGNLRYGLTRISHRAQAARAPAAAAAPGPPAAHGPPGPPGSRAGPRGDTARHDGDFDPIVALLGLESLLDRRPHQLSGGERQRVSLGRALLSRPQMLLLDEPLAALDVARREEVFPYLERLRDAFSIPMVYVSHQFDEVLRLATHVVLLDAGRVVAQGSLNEVSLLPALRAVVGPDSVGAVLDGVVTRVDPSCAMADLRVGHGELNVSVRDVIPGDRVRVQLLARDIILATEAPRNLSVRNELRGVVVNLVEDEQDGVLVVVDVGGANVLSRVTRAAVASLGLQAGLNVWALVKAVSTRGHAFRI